MRNPAENKRKSAQSVANQPVRNEPIPGSFGLRPEDMAQIVAIFAQYSAVETAVLFGSRAKGNYKPGSDVDIALKGRELTERMVTSMAYFLNEETIMPYHFDLLAYHRISNPDLVAHIDRVGQLLYTASPEQTEQLAQESRLNALIPNPL